MLDPISPEEAVQSYLDSRTDLSQSSFENHMYRLQRFKEWCDEVGMKNMNEITGRKLHQYKVWRAEDVNNVTLKNQLGTVRLFLRFCEDIEGVPSGVSEKLELPELGVADEVNDTVITENAHV